jgi:photosystem II stability/assembly factor-like uncharacterized protein
MRICVANALLGVAVIGAGVALGQQPKTASKAAAEPKFKAIWEPVNVKDDVQLRSVYFVSPEEGWVSGGRAEIEGGVIYHTKDAGATWDLQLGDPQSSDRSYRDLRFLSRTLGWAVQSTGVGDHKLLRSDGKDWKDAGTVAQHRGSYWFTSADTGFAAAGDAIVRTQDGGRKWQSVYPCQMKAEVKGLARNLRCEFAKLFFLNPQRGWAISNAPAADAGFLIATTDDGGTTWKSSVVLPGENPREGAIWFMDDTHGALLTGGKFFYSTDAGQTWQGATGQAPGKPDILFAGMKVGWAIHYQEMNYTIDGGQHWVSRHIGLPAPVEAFSLVSPESGYVVGDHGMVYRYRVVPVAYTVKGMLAAPSMGAR